MLLDRFLVVNRPCEPSAGAGQRPAPTERDASRPRPM
jgi:hypothetical protein